MSCAGFEDYGEFRIFIIGEKRVNSTHRHDDKQTPQSCFRFPPNQSEIAMNTATKRALFWTPRVLCMLMAAFLAMFAADVFNEGYGFWGTAFALLMHLLPSTILVLVVLVISWRWEWIGAVLFSAMAVFFIVYFWGNGPWYAFAGISGPLFLIGILFLLNWRYRAELRAR
jgi:hypothetical protein